MATTVQNTGTCQINFWYPPNVFEQIYVGRNQLNVGDQVTLSDAAFAALQDDAVGAGWLANGSLTVVD